MRKAKIIEAGGEVEEEKEDLPDKEPDSIFPKKDGDNSKLDTSNILSEGGRSSRHAKASPQELPQVGSGRAAATNATVAMAASTGRSNRFAKALERRAQLQEQEKKGIRISPRQAAASQEAIKAKKETPQKGTVNLYGPKGGRRYLTKDDSDPEGLNAEVLPTPKRRGKKPEPKKKGKKESSSEEESDSSDDEKDSNKNKKNSKPTPKRKPGRPAAKPAESASESSEEEEEDVKKNKKPIRPSLTKRLKDVSLNMMKPKKKVPAKVETPVSSRPRRGLKKAEPSEEEASESEEETPKVKKDNKKVITPSIKKKGKQPEATPHPNFDWKSLLLGGEKAEIVETKGVPNKRQRKVPETKTPKKVETPKKPVAPKKLVTPKLTKGGRKLPPLPKSLGPDEYDAYDEQLMMTPKILLRTLKRSIIEDKMPPKPKESLEEGEIPKSKQVADKKQTPPKSNGKVAAAAGKKPLPPKSNGKGAAATTTVAGRKVSAALAKKIKEQQEIMNMIPKRKPPNPAEFSEEDESSDEESEEDSEGEEGQQIKDSDGKVIGTKTNPTNGNQAKPTTSAGSLSALRMQRPLGYKPPTPMSQQVPIKDASGKVIGYKPATQPNQIPIKDASGKVI